MVWSPCPSALEKVCVCMSAYANSSLWQSFSAHAGINIFLDGFVPTENLRFRDVALTFKVSETADREEVKRMRSYQYPEMAKDLGGCTTE